jgi:hypothetical protein
MTRKKLSVRPAALAALMFFATAASAGPLAYYIQGDKNLPNAPSYDWYYGCSPTSAGMMMGFYDINGFDGRSYTNLVAGGQAEPSTWPYAPGSSSPLADKTIASPGHIHDYYSDDANRGKDNYGDSGDDRKTGLHENDSLADFMGTSQDSVGSINGSTTFYYWTDGTKLTGQDAYNYGISDKDGMYGMWEYLGYAGYTAPKSNFYTQLIQGTDSPKGATFADYVALIDAGMVVMVQVAGHSMFGYGYDAPGNTINFYNTWDGSSHNMVWGDSYEGMRHWGITVFEPAGGPPIPEPSTMLLFGSGLAGLAGALKKRR